LSPRISLGRKSPLLGEQSGWSHRAVRERVVMVQRSEWNRCERGFVEDDESGIDKVAEGENSEGGGCLCRAEPKLLAGYRCVSDL